MATFKRLDTVTVKGTDRHGIVITTHEYQGRIKIDVRFARDLPLVTYDAHRLEHYTVQSPDTIFYMDDAGVAWPYEVLDTSVDGTSVYVRGHNGLHWLLVSEATLVVPASMAQIARAMGR